MAIKKFLVSGVAALTLASVAIVPSAAFAQASPGANNNTGTAVAIALSSVAVVTTVYFVAEQSSHGISNIDMDSSSEQREIIQDAIRKSQGASNLNTDSKSKKRVRMARKARKYNWNLARAR